MKYEPFERQLVPEIVWLKERKKAIKFPSREKNRERVCTEDWFLWFTYEPFERTVDSRNCKGLNIVDSVETLYTCRVKWGIYVTR